MEKILELEQQLYTNIDLLEMAKSYCELNSDKNENLLVINTALNIMLKNQKNAILLLEKIDTN